VDRPGVLGPPWTDAGANRGHGGLREKREGGGAGWAERPDGPAGRWADWAESEGKILF
jgi:hypothetical protein